MTLPTEVRRTQVHAELDAYYARLYGRTRDELRFIMDTKEVHDEYRILAL